MKPYARILLVGGLPILRIVQQNKDGTMEANLDTPLTGANLFLLMKEGMRALAILGESGALGDFLGEGRGEDK